MRTEDRKYSTLLPKTVESLKSPEDLDAYTQALIRQVEAEGLIQAPRHMKQEILQRSQRVDYQLTVQTREISKKMQFFFYSLKVGAAVVTALFMVFAIPKELPKSEDSGSRKPTWVQEDSIGDKLNQGLQEFNQMFEEFIIGNRNKQMEDER